MAIEITHVRFDGDVRSPSKIISYKWISLERQKTASSTKPVLVAWVDNGNSAYVGKGDKRVKVAVVRPKSGDPFLRTHADGEWVNNLESLPTF